MSILNVLVGNLSKSNYGFPLETCGNDKPKYIKFLISDSL